MQIELYQILKHKLAEKNVNLEDCTVSTVYASSGYIGRENTFSFPVRVCDKMTLTGQSGCLVVEEAAEIASLVQIPILWGKVRILNELSQKIPFLVVRKK